MTNRFKNFTAVIMIMALLLSLAPLSVFAETVVGYTPCANEGQTCSFSGTRSVAYGANGVFTYKTITTSTPCTNDVFGDPIGGVVKSCYYKNTTTDTIAPTTTDNAPANWVNQQMTVNLAATDNPDGSGVANTYYTLNDGAQETGTSVVLTAEGVHTIVYWSVDNSGNIEAQHTAAVKIDKTAPTTSDNAPTGLVNRVITVTLSVYDGGSGVAATNYTVDGSVPQEGTTVSLTSEGVHTIAYWSVDNSGNVEAKHTKIVRVELLPIESNGQFHIDDIVKLINQGTLQQKDMNGDGIFDRKDINRMLNAITSTFISM